MIVSQTPGRLRVRTPVLTGAATRIRAELRNLRGVRTVDLNANTGSLLVTHDPGTLPSSKLIVRLESLLRISLPSEGQRAPGRSGSARAVLGLVNKGLLTSAAASVATAFLGGKRLHILSSAVLVGFGLLHALQYKRPRPRH